MSFISTSFKKQELHDPGFLRFIFGNTAMAPLWMLARLYLGYQWLIAGSHKLWGGDRWVAVSGPDGLPLKGFWEKATLVPASGKGQISYDWYRSFLTYMADNGWYHWFAWVVALGEVTVGICLILGVFTGLAALGGATLNFNFLLAGSASTNPVLFVLAILILFGWKVAGWIGVDRWLLPALGTPWQPGVMTRGVEDHLPLVGHHGRPAGPATAT
ncbi:MAG TPA: DoxX family membrane protein [Dehalococcoidia bacterium]|nr:DoxX family membrane protein [Dehalococcoidia bacterium]